MASQTIVHLPTPAEVEQAKVANRTLSKYADGERVQLAVRGGNSETDDLVLPGYVVLSVTQPAKVLAKLTRSPAQKWIFFRALGLTPYVGISHSHAV